MDWGQQVSDISSKATQHLISFAGAWLFSHFPIGILGQVWYLFVSIPDLCTLTYFAPWSTKDVAYKTLVWPKLEYAAPIWSPHSILQINQREKVQRTAARWWACRRWRNTSSISEMLDELEWPSLEPCGTSPPCFSFKRFIVEQCPFIEKDKYMAPAHSLKTTRSSHSTQYRRHQA